jgi:hypothetical protein
MSAKASGGARPKPSLSSTSILASWFKLYEGDSEWRELIVASLKLLIAVAISIFTEWIVAPS